MKNKISRRKAIATSLKVSLAAMGGYAFKAREQDQPYFENTSLKKKLPIRISLNTSTLLHYKLDVDVQIDMVADAGFDGVELWMRDIKAYLEKGGTSEQLKRKLEDQGANPGKYNRLFNKWCSDDPEERKKAIDQLREEMTIIAGLGGKYIAAPVQGLKSLDSTKFDEYSERYNAILELGDETGVTPMMNFGVWAP